MPLTRGCPGGEREGIAPAPGRPCSLCAPLSAGWLRDSPGIGTRASFCGFPGKRPTPTSLGSPAAYPRTVPLDKRRTQMLTTKIRNLLALTVFAAFAFTATEAFAQEAKVPQTAADHQ